MRRVRGLTGWMVPAFCAFTTVAFAQQSKPVSPPSAGDFGNESFVEENELIAEDMAALVMPLRYAKIDENGQVIDQWYDFPITPAEDCGAFICFDAFESDSRTDFPGDGFYNLNCNMGSARYRFADSVRNVVFVDDINTMAGSPNGGCSGVEFGRIQFAWWWQVTGAGSSERCVIAFSTLDRWEPSGNCTSDTFIDGVAFDFGVLRSSQDVGFYIADIPLCRITGSPLLTSQPDAVGAYKVVLANDSNLTPATMAQPMIWGTKPMGQSNQLRRMHWDVNNNGSVDSGECMAMSTSNCPSPLGTMIAFWRKGTETLPHVRAWCDDRGKLTARYWGYQRDERVQFKYDYANTNATVANRKGKGKSVWRDVPVGSHTVQALSDRTWAVERNTSCPPRR